MLYDNLIPFDSQLLYSSTFKGTFHIKGTFHMGPDFSRCVPAMYNVPMYRKAASSNAPASVTCAKEMDLSFRSSRVLVGIPDFLMMDVDTYRTHQQLLELL